MGRFSIAQDGPTPTADQLASQEIVRDFIEQAGDAIEQETEPSREQSLALTKLEEALMWAGKAIFAS